VGPCPERKGEAELQVECSGQKAMARGKRRVLVAAYGEGLGYDAMF